ncbi:hypothetical protein AB1N83_012478 [Pleurotus pulmonarius]
MTTITADAIATEARTRDERGSGGTTQQAGSSHADHQCFVDDPRSATAGDSRSRCPALPWTGTGTSCRFAGGVGDNDAVRRPGRC